MYCRLRGVHRGTGEATVTSSNTRVAGPLNYVEGHVGLLEGTGVH